MISDSLLEFERDPEANISVQRTGSITYEERSSRSKPMGHGGHPELRCARENCYPPRSLGNSWWCIVIRHQPSFNFDRAVKARLKISHVAWPIIRSLGHNLSIRSVIHFTLYTLHYLTYTSSEWPLSSLPRLLSSYPQGQK